MPFSFIRRAEKTNMTIGSDEHKVFGRMVLFFAAIVECLVISVTRSVYGTFRSIVKKTGRSSGSRASTAIVIMADPVSLWCGNHNAERSDGRLWW